MQNSTHSLLRLFFLTMMILSIKNVTAQSKKIYILPSIGISTPILDNGVGVSFAVNPSYSLTDRLFLDGQLSYNHTEIKGSFLSGKLGTSDAFNALIGAKYYLNTNTNAVRVYLNLLGGFFLNKEQLENIEFDPYSGIGFSGGVFLEFKNIVAGISYETPYHILFKVGYNFELKPKSK